MREATIYYVGTTDEIGHFAQPLVDTGDVRTADCEQVQRLAMAGDLCVFSNEFFSRFRNICREMCRRGCSTIYAIDGILEWRSAWEGGSGAEVMRPVLSHKIAVIGAPVASTAAGNVISTLEIRR